MTNIMVNINKTFVKYIVNSLYKYMQLGLIYYFEKVVLNSVKLLILTHDHQTTLHISE